MDRRTVLTRRRPSAYGPSAAPVDLTEAPVEEVAPTSDELAAIVFADRRAGERRLGGPTPTIDSLLSDTRLARTARGLTAPSTWDESLTFAVAGASWFGSFFGSGSRSLAPVDLVFAALIVRGLPGLLRRLRRLEVLPTVAAATVLGFVVALAFAVQPSRTGALTTLRVLAAAVMVDLLARSRSVRRNAVCGVLAAATVPAVIGHVVAGVGGRNGWTGRVLVGQSVSGSLALVTVAIATAVAVRRRRMTWSTAAGCLLGSFMVGTAATWTATVGGGVLLVTTMAVSARRDVLRGVGAISVALMSTGVLGGWIVAATPDHGTAAVTAWRDSIGIDRDFFGSHRWLGGGPGSSTSAEREQQQPSPAGAVTAVMVDAGLPGLFALSGVATSLLLLVRRRRAPVLIVLSAIGVVALGDGSSWTTGSGIAALALAAGVAVALSQESNVTEVVVTPSATATATA